MKKGIIEELHSKQFTLKKKYNFFKKCVYDLIQNLKTIIVDMNMKIEESYKVIAY